MGIQQSKGELLYQQVSYGNSEVVRVLHRDGEDLEWMDREGKTPLMLACMNAELYDVAQTLIELGSNVNAYRTSSHGGTPLHHAAKRGLENTVKLLLTHGANPLVLNDDCQTPIEVARVKGFSNVVRAIESHICLFSGWMREFYGPTFLDLFVPKLLSRRVWVVIVPSGSRNSTKPLKLELVVYASLQDAQPRTIMPLWKANLEEPKAKESDTSSVMMIVDNTTKTSLKLAPAIEGDRQQLKWFCDACKGIPQVRSSSKTTSFTGTCVICLDAPSEAVCVPCGHVAGCMSCLTEIKSKKLACPVCRAKIHKVIKLYGV